MHNFTVVTVDDGKTTLRVCVKCGFSSRLMFYKRGQPDSYAVWEHIKEANAQGKTLAMPHCHNESEIEQ